MPSLSSTIPYLGLALTILVQSTSALPAGPGGFGGGFGGGRPGRPGTTTLVATSAVVSTAASVTAETSAAVTSAVVTSAPASVSASATEAASASATASETGASTGAPIVPVEGSTGSLPVTDGTLKFVALGRGIQNYTCSAAAAAPVAIGAIATLYDALSLATSSESTLHSIPAAAVALDLPASGDFTVSGHTFSPLGFHEFAADGTPFFSLGASQIFGNKTGSVTAPSGSGTSPDGSAAVPWLFLTAKQGAAYDNVGLSEVYRVETAGGSAPASCAAAGDLSVQYSAEYWFYA